MHATIYVNHISRDRGGFVAGQKAHGGSNFLSATNASHRDGLGDVGFLLVLREFLRKGLGEAEETGVGGDIGRNDLLFRELKIIVRSL